MRGSIFAHSWKRENPWKGGEGENLIRSTTAFAAGQAKREREKGGSDMRSRRREEGESDWRSEKSNELFLSLPFFFFTSPLLLLDSEV